MGPRGVALAFFAVLLTGCAAPLPDLPPTPSTQAPLPPGAGDFASRHFDSPLSVGDAEQILERTEIFAMGGMPPKRQVQAFNVLVDRADATERFRLISEKGNVAGRLYALCALSQLDPSRAETEAKSLMSVRDRILVNNSDLIRMRPVSDMVGVARDHRTWEQLKREKAEADAYFNKGG
jgi:hypothetical protein